MVLITKNKKLEKILTIEKLTPQWGTLGPSEVEKNFGRNFANKLYIRSSYFFFEVREYYAYSGRVRPPDHEYGDPPGRRRSCG